MEDKKLYMVVNGGEIDNYSLFMWSEEELQSVIKLFTRINESDNNYAPKLYIYKDVEDKIIPLEEVEHQEWFKNGGYSIKDLDIFKLDTQSYTWGDQWYSIFDLTQLWPYRF